MGGSISILSYNVAGKPELPPNQSPLSHFASVSPGYFATIGIPMVRGREFERGDAVENPRVVVINEAMARREFDGQDAIGQRISFGPGPDDQPEWLEMVGVVGNIRQYGVEQEPVPTTYVLHTSSPRAAADDPGALGRRAGVGGWRHPRRSAERRRGAAHHAQRPLDEVIGASLTQRRFNMTLLIVFAAIALILAIAGIYGTVSYAVAQRTQELGIRVALGATRGDVLRLVLWDGLKPVALGLLVGIVGSFLLRSSLDRLVYGVSTSDPTTFLALPVLLAAVAVIASLIPALRAAKSRPHDGVEGRLKLVIWGSGELVI